MQRTAPSTTTRSLWRHCLRCLLLIAAVWGQERVAKATCGDYLEKHRHQAVGEIEDRSAADRPAENRLPARSPVCQGPNCRRHQPIPSKPAQELASSTLMEGALMLAFELVPPEKSKGDHAFQAAAISGPASRIFHPPRMVWCLNLSQAND